MAAGTVGNVKRRSSGSDIGRKGQGVIRIGLINNMPDAAVADTFHQYGSLLHAATGGTGYEIIPYWVPSVPRSPEASEVMAASCIDVGRLSSEPPDALVITGMEPPAGDLAREPYWPALASLLEWAEKPRHLDVALVPGVPCRGAGSRRSEPFRPSLQGEWGVPTGRRPIRSAGSEPRPSRSRFPIPG